MKYLSSFANHAAWLEDNRRRSNGEDTFALVGNAMRIRLVGLGKGIGSMQRIMFKVHIAAKELLPIWSITTFSKPSPQA